MLTKAAKYRKALDERVYNYEGPRAHVKTAAKPLRSGATGVRPLGSPEQLVLLWLGGAEPWVMARRGERTLRVAPETQVWELLMILKGRDRSW